MNREPELDIDEQTMTRSDDCHHDAKRHCDDAGAAVDDESPEQPAAKRQKRNQEESGCMPVEAHPILWSFLLDSSNTSESDGCLVDFENTTASVGCSVDFKSIASFVVVSMASKQAFEGMVVVVCSRTEVRGRGQTGAHSAVRRARLSVRAGDDVSYCL